MNFSRFLLFTIVVLFTAAALFGDDSFSVQFEMHPPGSQWTVVTRYDYRVRINQKYFGFSNREIRESYRVKETLPEGWNINGDIRILGETRMNAVPVAARLEADRNLNYFLGLDGKITTEGDGYPVLQGFPEFPEEEILPGDSWEAPLGAFILGPLGEQASIAQIASYRYVKSGIHRGLPAYFFDVSWALRYPGGDPEIDSFLNNVEGSHQLTLVIDAQNRVPVFARDKLSETWHWADGNVEQRDGFALIFWKGVPPMDKQGLRDTIETKLAGSFDEIRETERGLLLTMRSLHFQADTAVLLSEDRPLLDSLAAMIAETDTRTILVRGHAASVGRPEEEQTLSEKRAQFISNAMASRGIDPGRLIYEGVGAREPLASNETEEGRSFNRRVELLILED